MENQFTNLELQLIKSSLATRSDEEIADILERPVQSVRICIDQITGGGAAARSADVWKYKDEQAQVKSFERKPRAGIVSDQQRARLEDKKLREEKQRERFREAKQRVQKEAARQKALKEREGRSKFATRVVDYSQMRSVMVAKGTYVWVDKSVSNEAAISQYNLNMSLKDRPRVSPYKNSKN